MKHLKYMFVALFVFAGKLVLAFGSNVSQESQPETTGMMNHGGHGTSGGEHGMLDYIIIWVGVIIVAFTLIYSVKYLVKPKEDNPDHIKNIVKNEGF
ncbi:MAG: hypothetical protein WC967_06935 [Balneolaceae bacterium]